MDGTGTIIVVRVMTPDPIPPLFYGVHMDFAALFTWILWTYLVELPGIGMCACDGDMRISVLTTSHVAARQLEQA